MNKKLLIIVLVFILAVAGFAYISLSPNSKQRKKQNNVVKSNMETNAQQESKGTPPPPPPRKKIGKIAPPPPPPPKKNSIQAKRPKGYKNFIVKERSEPIHNMKTGESKLLKIDIKKGSENYNIKWFKKDGKKLTQVGTGKELNITAANNSQYYLAEIDDKIERPQQVFFEVIGSKVIEEVQNTEAKETITAKNEDEADTATTTPVETAQNTVEDKLEELTKEKVIVETPAPENETPLITALQNTDIFVKPGTPMEISYQLNSDKKHSIYWYHRPLGKKKSALIKGKKTLTFSLKKLNKYHQGEFYIQVRDTQGKVTKSPEYKVRIR